MFLDIEDELVDLRRESSPKKVEILGEGSVKFKGELVERKSVSKNSKLLVVLTSSGLRG